MTDEMVRPGVTENRLRERQSLLRKEVFRNKAREQFGAPALYQPLSLWFFTAFFLTLFSALVAFVGWAQIKDTVNVAGQLVPGAGAVKVYPLREGTYDQVLVAEGATVRAGQTLATIRLNVSGTDGRSLADQSLQSLEEQKAGLQKQIEVENTLNRESMQRMNARIEEIRRELKFLAADTAVLNESLQIATGEVDSMAPLLERKLVSQESYNQKRTVQLRIQQQINSLTTTLEMKRAELNDQLYRKIADPLNSQNRILALNAQLEQADLGMIDMQSRSAISVLAPIAGRVATLTRGTGEQASMATPLATIIPARAEMMGELFVPARAAGSIVKGQEVAIAYDGYPKETYGTYTGRVASISDAMVDPREQLLPVVDLKEPVYVITVALEQQFVKKGKERVTPLALQSGMTLSADIVTQKRTILAHIFDPIHNFGRQL